jgi:type VI protein secretion system component VasK
LPEVLLTRLLLFTLPFAIWFIWREIARRTGRPMGSAPWTWLIAAGGALVAVSLLASVILQSDNRADTYVPAQVGADGHVQPGRFEKR